MVSIIRLLNNKAAVWIAFVIALVSRYVLFFNYRLVDGDKSLQAAAAVNILKGRGYTLPVVSADDFVNIQYIRITEWPPLYSYLLVPLLKITNMNIDISCYIMDAISISIFLGFFWRILKQIGFSYAVQFLLIMWAGFFIRQYVVASVATDFLAAGFFIGAFSFFLSFLKRPSNRQIIFTVILLIASVYTRYMYLAVVFVFPLMIFLISYQQKNRRFILLGCLVSLVCIAALAPIMLQNYFMSGDLNDFWTKGMYFKNLTTFSPVFLDTFLDMELLNYQISNKTNINYRQVAQFFSILNYIIMLVLIGYFVKKVLFNRKTLITADIYNSFFFFGGLLSLTIIFFLAYASLTNELNWKSLGMSANWTYFAESRYYIFVHFYLMIIIAYQCCNSRSSRMFMTVGKKILLFIIVIDVVHGIWIFGKSNFQSRYKLTNLKFVEERDRVLDKLANQSREESFEPLFFASYNYYYMAYVSTHDWKLCTNFDKFDEKKVRTNHSTQIFLIVYSKSANGYYKEYIRKQGFELIENLKDKYQIYTKRILLNDK